jgi:hypothetical protein
METRTNTDKLTGHTRDVRYLRFRGNTVGISHPYFPPCVRMTFSDIELTLFSATLTTLVSTGDDSSVRMCPLPPRWLSLAKRTNPCAVVVV